MVVCLSPRAKTDRVLNVFSVSLSNAQAGIEFQSLTICWLNTFCLIHTSLAWLFIPVLTGTLHYNYDDHGKLFGSTSQNLSYLDLNVFIDGLLISSIHLWLSG